MTNTKLLGNTELYSAVVQVDIYFDFRLNNLATFAFVAVTVYVSLVRPSVCLHVSDSDVKNEWVTNECFRSLHITQKNAMKKMKKTKYTNIFQQFYFALFLKGSVRVG